LQALIFGAAHADYPAQPAYARLVELILPSLAFGLIYLSFGLLPGIIFHFAYDVVWFALPLFVSAAPGIWVDRLLVITVTLVPLWVVLSARLRLGRWRALSGEDLNRVWTPSPRQAPTTEPIELREKPKPTSPLAQYVLIIGGALGLAGWILASDFTNFAPPLEMDRRQARVLAEKNLAENDFRLVEPWQGLSSVSVRRDLSDRFVWQEGGEKSYRDLMGAYLVPPLWRVRFVKFEGDVAARSEEFEVWAAGSGELIRFRHQLPEGRPGASLSQEEARVLADSEVRRKYQLDPAQLRLVSSQPSKLPSRLDWVFTYADIENYPLAEGEARLTIVISGDQVVDSYRFIHVPEQWERAERNKQTLRGLLEFSCSVVLILLVLAGVVAAIIGWSRNAFSVTAFSSVFLILFVLRMISQVNAWPATQIIFSTARPYNYQVLTSVLQGVVAAAFVSASIALLAGLIHHWHRRSSWPLHQPHWSSGWLLGTLFAGFGAIMSAGAPSLSPVWADYSAAGWYWPLLGTSLVPIASFISRGVILLLLFSGANIFTDDGRRHRGMCLVVFFLFGFVLAGLEGITSVGFWLFSGALMALLLILSYRYVFFYQPALVIPALAAVAILNRIRQAAYEAFPGSFPGALVAIVLLVLISVVWFGKLSREEQSGLSAS
jgi:MFS family permease